MRAPAWVTDYGKLYLSANPHMGHSKSIADDDRLSVAAVLEPP